MPTLNEAAAVADEQSGKFRWPSLAQHPYAVHWLWSLSAPIAASSAGADDADADAGAAGAANDASYVLVDDSPSRPCLRVHLPPRSGKTTSSVVVVVVDVVAVIVVVAVVVIDAALVLVTVAVVVTVVEVRAVLVLAAVLVVVDVVVFAAAAAGYCSSGSAPLRYPAYCRC